VLVAAVPPAAPDAVDAAEADACCSSASAASPVAEPAEVLLGHLQAIITSLTVTGTSTGQPVLVSTDRDGKVRCSVLPKDPTKVSSCRRDHWLTCCALYWSSVWCLLDGTGTERCHVFVCSLARALTTHWLTSCNAGSCSQEH
jgi:hypothetical protein